MPCRPTHRSPTAPATIVISPEHSSPPSVTAPRAPAAIVISPEHSPPPSVTAPRAPTAIIISPEHSSPPSVTFNAEDALIIDGRPLHYVINVQNRREVIHFFTGVLGMYILRNDELPTECANICKEPSRPTWSKTMMGYGVESDNFCFQLAYNYGTSVFNKGNALMSITIAHKVILDRAQAAKVAVQEGNVIYGPENLKFIINTTSQSDKAFIEKILLASSNLTRTIQFWLETLGLKTYSRTHHSITLGFQPDETKIEFVEIDQSVSQDAYCGVVAFACPPDQLSAISEKIKAKYPGSIVPPEFVQLRTTVGVPAVTLCDPDGHQVCFYNKYEYRKVFLPTIRVNRPLENQLILEEANLCAPYCTCEMLHSEHCNAHRAKMRTEEESSFQDSPDAEDDLVINGRLLYYVINVQNRREVIEFFRGVLGMNILRNDEFPAHCEDICKKSTRPAWSKTMMGYGPESDNFCFQLAYNYGTSVFKKGNALMSITIAHKVILDRAKVAGIAVQEGNVMYGPGNLKFIINTTSQSDKPFIETFLLASSNLKRTIDFWLGTLRLKVCSRSSKSITLGFHPDETKIQFVEIGRAVSQDANCAVVAFACLPHQLSQITEKIKEKNPSSIVPPQFVQPRTTVGVPALILCDPDGHQVCFYDNDEYKKVFPPTIGASRSMENQLKLEEVDMCAASCTCGMLHGNCKNRRAKLRADAEASAGIGGGNQEEERIHLNSVEPTVKSKRRGG